MAVNGLGTKCSAKLSRKHTMWCSESEACDQDEIPDSMGQPYGTQLEYRLVEGWFLLSQLFSNRRHLPLVERSWPDWSIQKQLKVCGDPEAWASPSER